MVAQRGEGRFSTRRSRRGPARGVGRTLDEIRLLSDPLGTLEVVQSVSPWGVIVPEEAAFNFAFAAEMDGHRVPFGSTFIVHLARADGEGARDVRHLFLGPHPVVTVPLPDDWILDAVGQRAALTYTVEMPDGTRLPGPGIGVQVTQRLEAPLFTREGLEENEPIDPAKFPDGIMATVEQMPGVLPFHEPRLAIAAWGIAEGGDEMEEVMVLLVDAPAIGSGPLDFKIGKGFYTTPLEWGFRNVRVEVSIEVRLVPWPNHGWEYDLSLGGNPVLPPPAGGGP
jgi:hypothetical protein